jgi:hypothetical protein
MITTISECDKRWKKTIKVCDKISPILLATYVVLNVVMIGIYAVKIKMRNSYILCITDNPDLHDETTDKIFNAAFLPFVINIILHVLSLSYTTMTLADFREQYYSQQCNYVLAVMSSIIHILVCLLNITCIKYIEETYTGILNINNACKSYGPALLWTSFELDISNLISQLIISTIYFGIMTLSILIVNYYYFTHS